MPNSIYKTLFDHSKEGFVLTDSKGNIEVANQRFLDMFGYDSLIELVGNPIEIVVPQAVRNRHKKHKETYSKNPNSRSMGEGLLLDGQKKDGSLLPVEISLSNFIEQGEMKVLAIVTDVTIKREIENEIRILNVELEKKVHERTKEVQRTSALYSQIARNFPKGTINVFDKDLNYVFVDGKELFKMGIDGKKLIGSNYISRLSKDIAPTIEEKMKEVFNGTSHTFEIEVGPYIYEINAEPLLEEDGSINQILVVERNITVERRAEQEIKNSLKKEKELNELKSRFVSMASHEFRTPLSSIYSSATLLEKYTTSDQQTNRDKHIGRIKSSVTNLTGILNDILTLSKVEEGKIELSKEEFSLNKFTNELREETQALCKQNQQVQSNFDGVDMVFTDRKILKNIVLNLLSNAIKYSYEEGVILLSISSSDKEIEISVKDNGLGIPLKEQEKLFERFFRAENVFNIEGTGLGLNIVKKYIELLEGDITFTSIPEEETIFTVKIPIN